MSSKKEKFARFGMLTKGIVYSLIGVLTALAAFGMGGEKAGAEGALDYLAKQSFGQVILILMALGLLGYVFWRFYQAFANPQNLDNDLKGYVKRFAYVISAFIYGGFAYYAFKLAMGNSSSSSNMSSTNNTIIIAIGIGMLVKAIYDIYRAYSEKFREGIEESKLSSKEQKVLLNAGKFGHTARGLVIGLMAYLTLSSGLSSSNSISTQTDAFSYIQNEYGSFVLAIFAIGLLGYGIYMFIKAKYPSLMIK
ncbi:MAG TPA: DUF1206 domain-containing protein [Flavobacteriaceae bacterium]|nr:DUF1206 domain-containing protein [Flavobacteriaceae bacterium]